MTLSKTPEQLYVYVGPSAQNLELTKLAPAGTVFLPPVRRRDVEHLVEKHAPATLVIVDGTYFSFPAVGHIEIRAALERGWHVWGLSSMGAIRAYEMRTLGMRGFGEVYQQFFLHDDFQDDEVALLHADQAPYVALSEPMLHLRQCLKQLRRERIITLQAELEIITQLKSLWFGYRTVSKFRSLLADTPGGCQLPRQQLANILASNQMKQNDLRAFFQQRAWHPQHDIALNNKKALYA